jgi:hypothetical protein
MPSDLCQVSACQVAGVSMPSGSWQVSAGQVAGSRCQHAYGNNKALVVYSTRFSYGRALEGYSLNAIFGRYVGTAKHVFTI